LRITGLNSGNPLMGIYCNAIDRDLPVQVRTSCEACGSDVADYLAASYTRPFFRIESREVQVKGSHALAVIDADCSAMKIPHPGHLYYAGADCSHRRTSARALIETSMVVTGYFAIMETPNPERRVLTILSGPDEGFNPEPAWSDQVAQGRDGLHLSGRRPELFLGTADYDVLCRKIDVFHRNGVFLKDPTGSVENLQDLRTWRLVHLYRHQTLDLALVSKESNGSGPHARRSGRRDSGDSNRIALAYAGGKLMRERDWEGEQEHTRKTVWLH
jgi:hypothetical protein